MSHETQKIREAIRRGEIGPCNHGPDCQCPTRRQWDWAVARVYEIERAEEGDSSVLPMGRVAGL